MNSPNPSSDKIELHYRQQLSALMDGDLAADEARFLLRRLQHDEELNAQWERWQLLGDALRGRAVAPAPAGFAQRVGAAIALETRVVAAPSAATKPGRGAALRWGGALAASVAAVALFVARQQSPDAPKTVPRASLAAVPAAAAPAAPNPRDAAPAVAAASVADAAPVRTPKRNLARADARRAFAAARRDVPVRHAAVAPAMVELAANVPAADAAPHDPFARAGREAQAREPLARPWPRSVLQGYPPGGAFTASYGSRSAGREFDPFAPRLLPDMPPLETPAEPQR
jgi:negative regulator of sigma E activity